MTAKTYEEFMAQETFDAVPLPEIGRYIWNAAIYNSKENGNSLQQLKAEIAAFVHTVVANQGACLQQNVDNFIERMRQLSAV
jgi:hypothetical protein